MQIPTGRLADWLGQRAAPRVLAGCETYTRRRFHAFRLTPGSLETLRLAGYDPAPLVVVLNHPSWWDPMVGIVLARRLGPRRHLAPMQADQLAKVPFFRWLGLTPLDPDSPASVLSFIKTAKAFLHQPRATLWMTPQGELKDPREPVVLRPGTEKLIPAAARVLSVALEYAFWNDPQPEIFVRVEEVEGNLQAAMEGNSARLGEAVRTRNPALFESLWAPRTSAVHPLFDLWLRWRGQSAELGA